MRDAIVVGAGLAGLTAALRLAAAGASVTLVNKGLGGLNLSQGTVDVLGYSPERVARPYEALERFAADEPGHPYAHLGADAVREAVDFFTGLLGPDLLAPGTDENLQLPTAVGAIRPTAVAPPSFAAAHVTGSDRFLVVGLRHLKDFPASLVAGNLARTAFDGGRIEARHIWLDVRARSQEADSTGLTWARAFDDPGFRENLARELSRFPEDGETILLPAVLGLDSLDAWRHLQDLVGHPVAEISLQPPSVPGLRMGRALNRLVREAGVRILNGATVVGKETDGERISALLAEQAGRTVTLPARNVVFAPGGFESGALTVDSHLRITERALGLPLTEDDATGLITEDFWDSDHALFRVGLTTDDDQRVTDAAGAVVHPNLYAAGGVLAGASRWREKSGDGIAISTAVRAADAITREER